MRPIGIGQIAIALLSVVASIGTLQAQSRGAVNLNGVVNGAMAMPIRTLKDVRNNELFRTTFRQQYDFSCGSAAVATLLTHHYGHKVTEEQVFRSMFQEGDREQIETAGFSLLDMKNYLERLGFTADGFEATLDELAQTGTPAIALVRENGYNHFIVIKGATKLRVLIGDPSSGTRVITRREFHAMWQNQIFFLISSHPASFNVPAEWRVKLASPLDKVIDRNAVGSLLLSVPASNAF